VLVVVRRVGDDARLTRVVEVVVAPERDDVELLGRVGWVVTVEDVDDDDGDVVAAAGGVRRVDERLGGGFRVVDVGVEDVADVVVADFVDETVAAQHEPVAADDRHRPRVDPHCRLDAEGAGDDVAAWVCAGLVAADRTLGHELLHEAVVDRELPQTAVPHDVDARVADVRDADRLAAERVVDDGDRGDGGAHAGTVGVVERSVVDLDVRFVDRGHEVVEGVGPVDGETFAQPVHGHLAGDLAGQVAAHAVGDDEQPVTRVGVVFVL
jgi:hypothetical protein